MKGYSALAVANHFINKARENKTTITHLQLQKLVFLAHGWHLALHENNAPLISDEYAEAWKHGPVFPSLYHELKHNRGKPVKEYAEDMFADASGHFVIFTPEVDGNDEEVILLLEKIYEVYGHWTGGQLISLTHQQGTPWADLTNSGDEIKRNEHISEDLLIRLTHHATRCSVSWWRFAGRVKTAIPENTLGISVPVRN